MYLLPALRQKPLPPGCKASYPRRPPRRVPALQEAAPPACPAHPARRAHPAARPQARLSSASAALSPRDPLSSAALHPRYQRAFFIASAVSSSASMMHSTDISCIPAENGPGAPCRAARRRPPPRGGISAQANSGTSSHFVRNHAEGRRHTAPPQYDSSMHSTVCTQLSKLTDFIMKTQRPAPPVWRRQNARPPNSSRHRMNSRLHISGSAICAAAKNFDPSTAPSSPPA